jgi:hypothetical protein
MRPTEPNPDTSSADPQKLRRYSQDGLDLIRALRPQATAVDQAIRALQASGSEHIAHRIGATRAHSQLNDLVGDWYHLDEYVGDVATGFFKADQAGEATGGPILTVDDGALARLGRIGYANRDNAVAAAQRIAAELRRLRRGRATRADFERIVASIGQIGRGQYDPAFAVELGNQIGVRGFVELTAMIRRARSSPGGPISQDGIRTVQILSTTLTTALDTLRDVPAAERRDPDNQHLADDQRLGSDFVRDLTTDYSPDPYATGDTVPTDNDLSALLRWTDPPTAVAVAIANSRMKPLLGRPHHGGDGWGRYGGEVSNYAAMLGRNPNAAAEWLRQGQNIEQVLQRRGDYDADGGGALAYLVKAGVTHHDLDTRRWLMVRAIDGVAGQGEIHNPYLRGALAAGVDANMSLIDGRINAPFGYNEGARPGHVLDAYNNTHDFLREVMREPQAAAAIHESVNRYGLETSASLPSDPDERQARLHQLGRVQAMVTQAEENAGVGALIDEMLSKGTLGPTPGSLTNAGISVSAGRFPALGTVHEVSQAMGISAGDGVNWVAEQLGSDYDNLSREQKQAATQRATNRLNRAIWLAEGQYEADTPQGAALRESARGQPFVKDGSIKPQSSMTKPERQAFREWALNAVGNDENQGPIHDDHRDIDAGVPDVNERGTDVRDRRLGREPTSSVAGDGSTPVTPPP